MFELLFKKYFIHEIILMISSGSKTIKKNDIAFCLKANGLYLNTDGTTNLDNVVWKPVGSSIWYDEKLVDSKKVIIYDKEIRYKLNTYLSYFIDGKRYVFMNSGRKELLDNGSIFFAGYTYNWKFEKD